MAFFASKLHDRDERTLRRSTSIDRLKRPTSHVPPVPSLSVAAAASSLTAHTSRASPNTPHSAPTLRAQVLASPVDAPHAALASARKDGHEARLRARAVERQREHDRVSTSPHLPNADTHLPRARSSPDLFPPSAVRRAASAPAPAPPPPVHIRTPSSVPVPARPAEGPMAAAVPRRPADLVTGYTDSPTALSPPGRPYTRPSSAGGSTASSSPRRSECRSTYAGPSTSTSTAGPASASGMRAGRKCSGATSASDGSISISMSYLASLSSPLSPAALTSAIHSHSPAHAAHVHGHTPTTTHALDMKRLLSKPATPTRSLPSDSETSAGRRERDRERERRDKERERERRKERERRARVQSTSHESTPDPPVGGAGRAAPSRTRSAAAAVGGGLRSASSPGLLPQAATSNSHSYSPSPSPSPQPRVCAPDKPIPTPLTPAGAVALAYKQQELRRSMFEEGVSEWDGELHRREAVKVSAAAEARGAERGRAGSDSTGKAAGGAVRVSAEMSEEGGGTTAPGTPYYTIFGASSGKVVAIGSPTDSVWDAYMSEGERANSKQPNRLRRKLSRKASWKRKDRNAARGDAHDGRKLSGRTSLTLHERRSATLPRERRKSLRVSVEELVAIAGFGGTRAPTPTKSPVASLENRDSTPGSGRKGKLRREEKKEESSPTGRLWRLVKRLSSGALRETYRNNLADGPPPPVPAIPRDFLPSSSCMRNTETEWSEPGGLSRFMQSRPSLVLARTAPVLSTPTRQPRMASGSSAGIRPGATTRSSSPAPSSDLASSRFFPRPQSVRSSTSSYGDVVSPPAPPLPLAHRPIGQHIMPPDELHQLEQNIDEECPSLSSPSPNTRSTGHSTPHTPDTGYASLPFPPRRPPGVKIRGETIETPVKPPESPLMPVFSTEHSVNAFKARTDPFDTFGVNLGLALGEVMRAKGAPPPRPARSPRRIASSSVSLCSPPTSKNNLYSSPHSNSCTPPSSSSSHGYNYDAGRPPAHKADHSRTSIDARSQASTTRARRRSSLGTLRASSSPPISALTFRDMNEASRHAWTEQEKAEKWDMLLEQSAKAGGTLHVGGSGALLSDSLRDSTLSGYSGVQFNE